MSEVKLTSDQLRAVTEYGGELLVSAAAGSGKTKVLVERLMRMIENGADIDDFLIITYTNAAAAELRGKILDALYERIALEPDNRHFRREVNLCSNAQIETIHSFCSGIIRENAHIIGLSPDFRIADDTESVVLMRETLEDLLEKLYDSGDVVFYSLADTMGAGRDDSALVEIILDTHEKLLSHPYPEKWVDEQLRLLRFDGVCDAASTVWGRVIIESALNTAEYWCGKIRNVLEEAAFAPDFERAYGESLNITFEGLVKLCSALKEGTWDEIRNAVNVEFSRAKNVSGYEDLKAVRTQCKKEIEKLSVLFSESSEKTLSDMKHTAPAIEALLGLVLRFDEEYSERKRKKGILDFSDQEHLALKILFDRETGSPTSTARGISERFREIMVDEYQDVNEIQEMIFAAVSKEGKNVFMVGDVKQSIYRFRLADPRIFLRKYKLFTDADEAAGNEGRKVILSRNFRSRKGVLEAANFIFKNVMSAKFGDLDYTEREFLYNGAVFPDTEEPSVELDIINAGAALDDEQSEDKTEIEARFAAYRIKELVGNVLVSDGAGGMRPARFGDIAILMRSPKSRLPHWSAVLGEYGIPIAAENSNRFFDEIEISIAVSLLTVIDNPHQDISLISVLRSPIYGFTSDELANMRLEDKQSDFYTALCRYAEKDAKSSAFISELKELRKLAPDMSTDRLLWHICEKTGLFAIVGAMPGGTKRKANLMLLFEYARRFESAGFKGLFSFVNYIRKLDELGKIPVPESTGAFDDAVTVTSIHKSKGLEYPIVILADLAHRFNTEDSKKPLLIHPEIGVGPKRIDLERKIEYPTIARKAIKIKTMSENLSEELRVLYVAMTRAREKLIMLASFADAPKEIEKLSGTELPVPVKLLEGGRSFADWILMTALRREESRQVLEGRPLISCDDDGEKWIVRLIEDVEDLVSADAEPERVSEEFSDEEIALLADRLDFVYPYHDAVNMPSKITATELKGSFFSSEAAEDAAPIRKLESSYSPERPRFMDGTRGLGAAEKGTATHIVMQFADYDKCKTIDGVRDEIERLRDMGTITDEQAEAVRPGVISRFFASEPGKIISECEKLWRELKFSILVDSAEISGMPAGEELLLQGVVDCCALYNGGLVIIDFKTDYVTEETADDKAEFYSGQLDAYAIAMERILKLPVKRKILCFLTAGINRTL